MDRTPEGPIPDHPPIWTPVLGPVDPLLLSAFMWLYGYAEGSRGSVPEHVEAVHRALTQPPEIVLRHPDPDAAGHPLQRGVPEPSGSPG